MLLKRFSCPNCGANGPVPTRSPFLQCEACGTISDFDWGVARQLPDWLAHQALNEQLFREQRSALETAGEAHDLAAWELAYREVLEPLVTRFPDVYPARVAEPAYRAHFIAFQVAHQARLAIEPTFVRTQQQIIEATRTIEWKQKRAVLDSLWRVVEIAVAHFEEQGRVARELPPGMPPDFSDGYMRQVGISMTVQEWLPLLEPADRLAFVQRLGVAHQYVEQTSDVTCNTCGAALPPLKPGETRTRCPYCNADLHAQRAGARVDAERKGDFAFIKSELEIVLARGQALEAIEVLDGVTHRNPKRDYRMITLRACLGRTTDTFYEVSDEPAADPIANALAWAEAEGARRGIAIRRIPYREHPRCATLPASVDELRQRVIETLPDATPEAVIVIRYGHGFTYEVNVAGTVVRLALDENGTKTELLRSAFGR